MKRVILFLTFVFVTLSIYSLMADDKPVLIPAEPQPVITTEQPAVIPVEIVEVLAQNCPVMGGGVDKAVFTIHEGHIYYFCCPGCIGSFKAEPEKFIEMLKDAPTRVLKVNNVDGKCPISLLPASLQVFKIDEKVSTITFFNDEKSLEKSGK